MSAPNVSNPRSPARCGASRLAWGRTYGLTPRQPQAFRHRHRMNLGLTFEHLTGRVLASPIPAPPLPGPRLVPLRDRLTAAFAVSAAAPRRRQSIAILHIGGLLIIFNRSEVMPVLCKADDRTFRGGSLKNLRPALPRFAHDREWRGTYSAGVRAQNNLEKSVVPR
jgi:hypothetical protein